MLKEKRHGAFEMKSIDIKTDKQLKSVQKMQRELDKNHRVEERRRRDEEKHKTKRWREDDNRVRKEERQQRRGGKRGLVRRAGRAAAFLGGGLMGLLTGTAIKGYRNYMQYHESLSPLVGLGGRANRDVHGAKGGRLGYKLTDVAAAAKPMARATGTTSPAAMLHAMRATAMGAGEVGDMFGAIRGGGDIFSGTATTMDARGKTRRDDNRKGQGTKQFEKIMAAGMYSGLEKARLPEFFKGITSLMRAQGSRMAGDVSGLGFSKLGGAFGRFGEQNNLSGLQGARGMGLLGKVHQGIIAPGGGEAGKAFMQQAFGFGRPGGGASYYEAEKQREKGLAGPENFGKVMGELTRQYGTGQDAALKLRETFGVSLDQAESLIKINESGEASKDKLEKVNEIMEESKSLEEQALKAMKNAGPKLGRIATLFDKSVANGALVAPAIEHMELALLKVFEGFTQFFPLLVKIMGGLKLMFKELMRAWYAMPGTGDTPKWLMTNEMKDRKALEKIEGMTPMHRQHSLSSRAASEDPKVRKQFHREWKASLNALRREEKDYAAHNQKFGSLPSAGSWATERIEAARDLARGFRVAQRRAQSVRKRNREGEAAKKAKEAERNKKQTKKEAKDHTKNEVAKDTPNKEKETKLSGTIDVTVEHGGVRNQGTGEKKRAILKPAAPW